MLSFCTFNVVVQSSVIWGTLSAANGSSEHAYCSTHTRPMICDAPENSVLFDREIPTLVGLSGHLGQLITNSDKCLLLM